MNEHIKYLADSLESTTKTELLLNERSRELTRIKMDNAYSRSRIDALER